MVSISQTNLNKSLRKLVKFQAIPLFDGISVVMNAILSKIQTAFSKGTRLAKQEQ
jgi:hypothetical protein